QAAGDADAAVAAPAADRLGRQAARAPAGGEQVGVDHRRHVSAQAAVAAEAAAPGGQLAVQGDGAGNIDPAVAAAAAQGLGHCGDRAVADGAYLHPVGARRQDGQIDRAGVAAVAAEAADADRFGAAGERAAAGPGQGVLAGDVDAGAAGGADLHPVGARRPDGQIHRAGVAAVAAEAADADRYGAAGDRAAAGPGQGDRAGDVDAAVAAAAAHALGDHPVGAVQPRAGARDLDLDDVGADLDLDGLRLGADVRADAAGDDVAGDVNVHRPGVAAGAAEPADAQAEAAGVAADRAGNAARDVH